VVTGGSRGIGAATAVRLAAAGHDVAISYRAEAAAAEAVAAAVRRAGRRCLVVRADVTVEADVERISTPSPRNWEPSPAWSTTPA